MRYTLISSAILALAQATGSHFSEAMRPPEDASMYQRRVTRTPLNTQEETPFGVAFTQSLADPKGSDHTVTNAHNFMLPKQSSENKDRYKVKIPIPVRPIPQSGYPEMVSELKGARPREILASEPLGTENNSRNIQRVQHNKKSGFQRFDPGKGPAIVNSTQESQRGIPMTDIPTGSLPQEEKGLMNVGGYSFVHPKVQSPRIDHDLGNPTKGAAQAISNARIHKVSVNLPPFSSILGDDQNLTQTLYAPPSRSTLRQPIARPIRAGNHPTDPTYPIQGKILPAKRSAGQDLVISDSQNLPERLVYAPAPNTLEDRVQQTNSTPTKRPRRFDFVPQEAPHTAMLKGLLRPTAPTDRHGVVDNAHNTQSVQYEPQKTRQPVHPLALTATFKIINLAPPATKDWFGGDTWRDIDFKMRTSYNKMKIPLSFRQHSARTIGGTRPEKSRLGIEGKGNQFGFRLRPSFLAFYDGEWVRNDKWIAYRTKNFMTEINGEYQDLLGCREFAEALSDEKRLTELGIDKDGIFALLVASWDKTEIRVRMTENSPVALRVLRPVDGTYEIVTSSVPGELVSCPVEENYVVIMGQSSEMELLGKLKVEDSFKSLLYQLSDDHFWTVSILSKWQPMPINRPIETIIPPPPTTSYINNSNARIYSTIPVDPSITHRPRIPTYAIPLTERKLPKYTTLPQPTQRPEDLGASILQAAVSQHAALSPKRTDWFHGPIKTFSNQIRVTYLKLPFSFRNQFVFTPSYINIGNTKNGGITGTSHRFSFTVRPNFIVFTEGRWDGLLGQSNCYNSNLVKAIKDNELNSKGHFGIGGSGLCAILEKVKDEANTQVFLHVRVIRQLPVTLKVMRRIGDSWVSIPVSEESDNLKSYKVMGKDIIIVGETGQELPIQSKDLWEDLTMSKSFRFLLLARLEN